MTDPAPNPAPLPPRARWRRARIYAWAILVVTAIWLWGVVTVVRNDPKRIVDEMINWSPFPGSAEKVKWLDSRTLQIDRVKLGDFFYADSIIITFSGRGLWNHHLARMEIVGGQVFTKALDKAMKQFDSENKGLDWVIDKLEIRRGTVLVENVVPEMPPIPIRLGVGRSIVLNDIELNKPDSSPSMTQERTMEIESVNLISPYDPLAPVLSFPLTRMRFTYSELWHHHIREIDFVRPVMHLGQDLFWFSEEFKKERASAPDTGVNAPWEVGHLEVQYGQLALNAFGQPAARLPFYFETRVDDIRLDQLDKISAKSTIAIRRLDQDYPAYKIRIVNLHGKLEFSIPPTDATANNVVPTVFIDELSWNEIPATEVWSSVTFDPNGIYGNLGGKCEGGYIKGNFEIYYTKGFLWNADLFAEKIDCRPVAERVAGKYISLTGTLDGKIEVKGRATEILACQGLLAMANPGVLEIKSMKDLLKRLPPNTSIMKEDLLKIAVDTFQTYPYRTGELKIDYKPEGGVGTLKLESPNGPRHLEMYWHPYDEAGASSKVAKEADSQ